MPASPPHSLPPVPSVLQPWGANADGGDERLWAFLVKARVAVAAVLAGLQTSLVLLGHASASAGLLVCAAHLAATLATRWGWPVALKLQAARCPWVSTVGVDWMVFALLQLLQPGGLNYSLLFTLPVLMAAVTGPRRRGLAVAASVTLFLLLQTLWAAWLTGEESTARLLQSAITGTGYFFIALLAHHLSSRLAKEAERAETNRRAAHTQAEVNALVIEALADGVLVVDPRLRVWAANPAAQRLLALPPAPSEDLPRGRSGTDAPLSPLIALAEVPHLGELVALIGRSIALGQATEAELSWSVAGQTQQVRVRTQPIADPHAADAGPACVVFLDDLRELQARIRAEKLASMGRMTVAVAHEIRNPLTAIAQAMQLLHEELHSPLQRRLGQMIETNAQRLNRIVEDILNVVRVQGPHAPTDAAPLLLDQAVHHTIQEWCAQHPCGDRLTLALTAPAVTVRFDPEHLRRVLVNLLDNAHRYARMRPGAIRVETETAGPAVVRLTVWSDGAPLEPAIQRHLFEPFFSSESRSSGMGLYLCRELCARHQASLDYARSHREGCEGNAFTVTFPQAQAAAVPSP